MWQRLAVVELRETRDVKLNGIHTPHIFRNEISDVSTYSFVHGPEVCREGVCRQLSFLTAFVDLLDLVEQFSG